MSGKWISITLRCEPYSPQFKGSSLTMFGNPNEMVGVAALVLTSWES